MDFVSDKPDSDLTTDLIDRIDGETAVVTVGSVQFATGTVVDIPRLRVATARAGVRLVVDATQEAGAMNRPIGSWRPKSVVTSGYKWLGGHGGVALGVISPQLLEESPALPGWMSAPEPFDFDATRLPLSTVPAGTPSRRSHTRRRQVSSPPSISSSMSASTMSNERRRPRPPGRRRAETPRLASLARVGRPGGLRPHHLP